MAKSSKKTPSPLKTFEINSLTRLLSDGLKNAYGLIHTEPIVHIPNVDMYSTQNELVVEVEMPGVRKDDIEVFIHKNALTVKAAKFECFEEEKINYVCMERAFGRIFKTVDLPFPVDTARMKASYKDGVLTISVPRIEEKRTGAKRIQITSEE